MSVSVANAQRCRRLAGCCPALLNVGVQERATHREVESHHRYAGRQEVDNCFISITLAAAVAVAVHHHWEPSIHCLDVQRHVLAALKLLPLLVDLQVDVATARLRLGLSCRQLGLLLVGGPGGYGTVQ
jgi:hypothetical protein